MTNLIPIDNQQNNQIKLYKETYFDLVDRFLAVSDIVPNSKKFYKKILRYWYEWCEENNVTTPTREHILIYKNSLNIKSRYTQAAYLSVVGEFYNWLDIEGIYKDITKGIKVKHRQVDQHTRSKLTLEEIHALLNSIDTSTFTGSRDFAMINLMVRTGLRMIELNRADVNDFFFLNDRRVLYVQGKGRIQKDEFVIINEETYKPLENYINTRQFLSVTNNNQPLFVSHSIRGSVNDPNKTNRRLTVNAIRYIVWTRLKQAGIKRKDIVGHSLRHTTATLAIDAGATIEEVQALMRHKDPRTTMIYIKERNRFKNAAEDKIKI